MLDQLYLDPSRGLEIPDELKKTLSEQAIDEDRPGTILRDFDALLEFIGDEGMATTSKYFFLPQSKLDSLNAAMSHPVSHRLKRPQQKSFPHLNGLFLLLRASGMGTGMGSPPGGRLMLERETVETWRELNPTERYFALLESWLVQGSPEIIGERSGMRSGCFFSLIDLAQRLLEPRTRGSEYHRGGVLYGTSEHTNAALMEMFGWLKIEYGEPADGGSVNFAVLERVPFGDAMVAALYAHFFTKGWPAHDDDRPAEPGVLRPLLETYFPEYRRVLAPRETPYRKGVFTWRVSLPRAWRRIDAPDDATLDDLARAILDAFDFDDDHLYCFELQQNNGRRLRVACPYEEDAAVFTDETALGELQIAEGAEMIMIFDYGDNWQFRVKLEKVDPQRKQLRKLRVVKKSGQAPAQYEWADD